MIRELPLCLLVNSNNGVKSAVAILQNKNSINLVTQFHFISMVWMDGLISNHTCAIVPDLMMQKYSSCVVLDNKDKEELIKQTANGDAFIHELTSLT